MDFGNSRHHQRRAGKRPGHSPERLPRAIVAGKSRRSSPVLDTFARQEDFKWLAVEEGSAAKPGSFRPRRQLGHLELRRKRTAVERWHRPARAGRKAPRAGREKFLVDRGFGLAASGAMVPAAARI